MVLYSLPVKFLLKLDSLLQNKVYRNTVTTVTITWKNEVEMWKTTEYIT